MRLLRERCPLAEMLIRLLIVTALAVFPFVASRSQPAEKATTERASETALREGTRK